MSETITEHETVEELVAESAAEAVSEEQWVTMLVDRARSERPQLTGEGGLLQQLTKRVLESALEGEITDHVGCDKHGTGYRTKATRPARPRGPGLRRSAAAPSSVATKGARTSEMLGCSCPRTRSRTIRGHLIWPWR